MINLDLDKNKRYVVACSYGPDSMALLSGAIENGLNVVVAHVNYHKRDVSNFEEKSLREYCKLRNIPIEVLDTTGLKYTKNFQEWAREIRYKFFADVMKKYKADAVLVAHQEDDLIETYLMQKNRKNIVKNAGIAANTEIFGVKIIRPLLKFSKQFLKDYDDENNIPYSIDVSNLSDDYERNKIRHHIVSKMTKEERNKIVETCKQDTVQSFQNFGHLELNDFLALSYEAIVRLLDFKMNLANEHTDLSRGFIEEIKKAFASSKNVFFNITQSVRIEKSYGTVYILNSKKLHHYVYDFQSKFINEFLDIDFSQGADDRNIFDLSKLQIIKNVSQNDNYLINNYTKQIRREFIDWKMPLFLRKVWPGIYDKKGNLIYTPRYRKTYTDNHKSKMKIDIEYFEKF